VGGPARSRVVVGSAARGDGDTTSDIDLFVVRPRAVAVEDQSWRAQLHSLARGVARWIGNHAGISEVGEDELDALVGDRPPVMTELERDAVTLAGPDARRVLIAAVRPA